MPTFTIETTYHLPIFRHRTIEAPTVAEACRIAIEDDDWSRDQQDFDASGQVYVSGAWPGAHSAYHGEAITVPAHFRETVERKADHFDELLKQLAYAAQPMGLSGTDFEQWFPGAVAAVEKAKAIVEERRDPDDPAV
jgi:hypothetical protein